MNAMSATDLWVTRLLRVAALLSAGAAVILWVAPVNVPGRNLVPVGCGAPSSPSKEPLTNFVCADQIAIERSTALALLLAAAALLVLSELVLPRTVKSSWARPVAVAATVALPVLALSLATLFSVIADTAADGTLIRCGSPVAPSTDPISRSVCGQLAARDKALGLGGVALSVLALLGAAYVGKGRDDGPAAGQSDPPEAQDARVDERRDHAQASTPPARTTTTGGTAHTISTTPKDRP